MRGKFIPKSQNQKLEGKNSKIRKIKTVLINGAEVDISQGLNF